MSIILQRPLSKKDKEQGLEISKDPNKLLPGYNAELFVKDRNSGDVMIFDYQVSGRQKPVIRGTAWTKFIGGYPDRGATVILSTYQGSDANFQISVE